MNGTPKFFSEGIQRFFYLIPNNPSRVQIEITNRCNLDCKMCPRKKLCISIKDMPFDIFCKIVEKLRGAEEITLTGWGEPLLHPKIIEMIKLCKSKGFKVKLTTNGTALTKKLGKKLVKSKIDVIGFSLESTNPQQKSFGHLNKDGLKNIEALGKMYANKNPIVLQFTMQKNGLEEIDGIMRFAKKIHAKRVNLMRLNLMHLDGFERPGVTEEKEIFRRAMHLGKEFNVGVDCINYAKFDGLARFLFENAIKLPQFKKNCQRTFNYIYINSSGDVMPCCELPSHNVGNILKQSLSEIWRGEKFKQFRKNQKSVCSKCDALKPAMLGG